MRPFENLPPQGLESVNLGMPAMRTGRNPFEQPSFIDQAEEPINWQVNGLCAQTDPDALFPGQGQSVSLARSICKTCNVIEICREDTLRIDLISPESELIGYRGGMGSTERKKLRSQALKAKNSTK